MKTKRESFASDYITDALLILMKQKNYKDITVTEICEKAGVTRMSFYRSFKTKDDILRKWFETVSRRYLVGKDFDFNNVSREFLIDLFTYLEQYREAYLAMYDSGLFYDFVKEQLEKDIANHQKETSDIYRSYFLTGGIYSVFILWLKSGQKESPSEIADKLEKYLVY